MPAMRALPKVGIAVARKARSYKIEPPGHRPAGNDEPDHISVKKHASVKIRETL